LSVINRSNGKPIKPLKSGYVLNPVSHRQIKINSPKFTKLLTKEKFVFRDGSLVKFSEAVGEDVQKMKEINQFVAKNSKEQNKRLVNMLQNLKA
jgi:hypothetical protein